MRSGCDLIRVSLGAHTLGALDADERTRVDSHLASCEGCREEFAQLEQVSNLLAELPTAEVKRHGLLADEERERATERRASQPKRTRARGGAAALAAAAAIAAVALALAWPGAGRRGAPAPSSLTASASNRTTNVSARVTLQRRAPGTEAVLRLRGVRPHRRCRLMIVSRSRTRELAATWQANYEGAASVTAASRIPVSAIDSLEVLGAQNHVLVRIPISGTASPA